MTYRLIQCVAAAVLCIGAFGAGCDPNVTSPLTDAVTVGVINATPYRAVFTLGAYDNLDQETLPFPTTALVPSQDDDTSALDGTNWLQTGVINPGSLSPLSAACRRAISIGGAEMIDRINDNKDIYTQVDINLDERVLFTGIHFSDAPAGSDDEVNPTVGSAEPLTLLQGVDFPCGSFVVIRLVEDDAAPGGFKAVFEGVIQ